MSSSTSGRGSSLFSPRAIRTVILVLLVERAGDDARRLLDDGWPAGVRLEVILAQPNAFEFEAVPLAALAVDRVHVVQGILVPLDQVGRWGRSGVHVPDRPRPATQRDVGEVRVGRTSLHPYLGSGGEAGRGPWP